MERPFPIAIVVSRFNEEITDKLLEGARARLEERGISADQVTVVHVPGAVEAPLAAQALARQKRFQAIVVLGAVIRGETTHYETVCQMAAEGCMRVGLDHHVPVVFGVLTTENEEQALDRVGGKHGHKGRDAIDTAIEMATLIGNTRA